MNLRKSFIVLKKELLNSIRDKRIIYSTFLVPIILPVFMLLPMSLATKKEMKLKEKPSYIAIIGDRDEDLVNFLRKSKRFRFIEIPESPLEAIENEKVHCVLEIEREGERIKARILYDATRDGSRVAMEKLKTALLEYSKEKARQELEKKGLSPEILEAVRVVEKNVVSPSKMGGYVLGMVLGVIIAMVSITGGMVVSIDATAGEKERKTLEVLLASPLTRMELLLGKYLATILFALLSVVLTALSILFIFKLGSEAFAGEFQAIASFPITFQGLLSLILIVIFYIAFMASIALSVGTFARSFREAQNYFTPITLIVVLPVIFLQTLPASPSIEYFYLPIFNVILSTREVFMGTVDPSHLSTTLFANIFFAFLGFRVAYRIFSNEKAITR